MHGLPPGAHPGRSAAAEADRFHPRAASPAGGAGGHSALASTRSGSLGAWQLVLARRCLELEARCVVHTARWRPLVALELDVSSRWSGPLLDRALARPRRTTNRRSSASARGELLRAPLSSSREARRAARRAETSHALPFCLPTTSGLDVARHRVDQQCWGKAWDEGSIILRRNTRSCTPRGALQPQRRVGSSRLRPRT